MQMLIAAKLLGCNEAVEDFQGHLVEQVAQWRVFLRPWVTSDNLDLGWVLSHFLWCVLKVLNLIVIRDTARRIQLQVFVLLVSH